MLCGYPPFGRSVKDGGEVELKDELQVADMVFPENVSKDAVDFVRSCLIEKESERPKVDEICEFLWVQNAQENKLDSEMLTGIARVKVLSKPAVSGKRELVMVHNVSLDSITTVLTLE